MVNLNAEDKLIKCKINLQRSNPFFAYLVLHLKPQEMDLPIETPVGIDIFGNLSYNKKFIESLEESEVEEILVHEVLHMVFAHLLRRGSRNPRLFNVASDVIVNEYIVSEFQNKYDGWIAQNGLTAEKINQQFPKAKLKDVKQMTSEELYDILWKLVPKVKVPMFGKGNSEGKQFDKHYDIESMSEKDKRELEKKCGKSFEEIKKDLENEMKEKLARAYQEGKVRGKVPSGLEQLFDKLMKSKMNWKSIIYKRISMTIPHDFSWRRPSKKSLSTGIYMPTTIKQNVDILVSVDTSGSVWGEDVNQFMSEVVAISKAFESVNMTVITHDCEIQDVIEIRNGNAGKLSNIKIHGSGGTSHIPIFEWIKEHKKDAKLLIALTDGYSEFPEKETIPTIWVLSKDHCEKKEIPFGEILELDK